MKYQHVFTGSYETEEQLCIFLNAAKSLDSGVPRKLFTDDYYWTVMTTGRNGVGCAYPGSKAPDDTGGFFEERDGMVFLTDKAKSFITL